MYLCLLQLHDLVAHLKKWMKMNRNETIDKHSNHTWKEVNTFHANLWTNLSISRSVFFLLSEKKSLNQRDMFTPRNRQIIYDFIFSPFKIATISYAPNASHYMKSRKYIINLSINYTIECATHMSDETIKWIGTMKQISHFMWLKKDHLVFFFFSVVQQIE